jgi:hypothetical protein
MTTYDKVTGIADGTTSLDGDNPGAAVGIVALVVLLVIFGGGLAWFMWLFSQVTR